MQDAPQKPPLSEQLNPKFPSVPQGTFYINFFDVINDVTVRGLMALCTDILAKAKPTPATLYFAFSSNGGSVAAGITLYNFLRALPVELIMHNAGSVNSIATAIFLAGSRRLACPHSSFLFHGVASGFSKDSRLTRTQLRERMSQLEQDEARIKELIVERSQLTESEILELFNQGETKDPAFALQKGVIEEIQKLSVPIGARMVTANFGR